MHRLAVVERATPLAARRPLRIIRATSGGLGWLLRKRHPTGFLHPYPLFHWSERMDDHQMTAANAELQSQIHRLDEKIYGWRENNSKLSSEHLPRFPVPLKEQQLDLVNGAR
jgi:hypothetical protein